MEQVLPFIIAAFVFGFQIYSNFKKEQKKAMQRRVQAGPVDRPIQREPTPSPAPRPIPPVQPKRPVAVPVQSVQTAEVEEVRRARQIHQAHQHGFKRLEPFKMEEEEAPEVSFDLREAVIQSIILERPYV